MLRNSLYLFFSLQVICIILKAYFRGVQVPSPLSNSLCLYKPLAPPGTGGKEPACQCWLGVKDAGSITGGEDPLEKGMAIHSSIPTWRIPWTEDPAGLQFMGSHGVRND